MVPENITSDMDCYAQFQFVGLYFRQYLNGTLLSYEDTDNLDTVASFAFAGERNLVSVSMPVLTAASEKCFWGCDALTDVNLPKVLATNPNAFYYCAALEYLKLPELTILNTGDSFANLPALKELRLPKNTSTLANNQIFNCLNLELLDLGVTAEIGATLSNTGFTKLTTLILRNGTEVVTPYTDVIFHANTPIAQGTGKILVPRSMVASYKAHSAWGAYSDVIYAIEDHPDICE